MTDTPIQKYNPQTNEVATYNADAKTWDVVQVSNIPPENKFTTIKDSPDGEYKAGFNKFTKKWERVENPDWIDKIPVPSSVERGIRKASLIDDYLGLESGIKTPEDVAKEAVRVNRKIAEEPMTAKQKKGMEEIYSSKDFPDFAKNVVKNPSAVGAMFGESLGSMSGTALASIGLAGVGKLAKTSPFASRLLQAGAFGVGSGVTEAANTFFDSLSDHGVDTTNEEAVRFALQDPKLVEILNTKAILRGVPVGAFDGITAGLAGKSVQAFEHMGQQVGEGALKSALKGHLAETGVQAAGGAGGEALAQIGSEGKITNPIDVGLEAIMEGVTSAPEALYMSMVANPTSMDLKMPAFKDIYKNKTSTNPQTGQEESSIDNLPEVEVINKATAFTKTKRKDKAKKVEDIVDATTASDLKAFQPLVDSETTPSTQPTKRGFVRLYRGDLDPNILSAEPTQTGESVEVPVIHPVFENFGKNPETGKVQYKATDDLMVTPKQPNKELSVKESLVVPVKAKAKQTNPIKPVVHKLPDTLNKSRVNFGTKPVSFTNDVDKALYITSTPNKKSVKDIDFRNWLKDTVGMTDQEIDSKGKVLRTKVKEVVKATPQESPIVSVPDSIQDTNTPNDVNFQREANLEGTSTPILDTYDLAVENLRGVDLKDASPELVNLMDRIKEQLRKSFGDGVAIKFYDVLRQIRSDTVTNPVRGAQWLNTIAVAININQNRTNSDVFETSMHEGFHYAQDHLLNEKDKQVLKTQSPRLRRFVQKMTGLNDTDIDNLILSEDGEKELQATAFGIYASNKLKDPNYSPEFLNPQIEGVFKKILKFFRTLADALRGTRFEDVFEDVFNGRRIQDVVEDGIEFNRGIRWQKITQAVQEKHQQDQTESAIEFGNQLRKAIKIDEQNLSPLGFYGKYLASMTHLASKSRVFAFMYSTERARQEITNKFYAKWDDHSKASGLKGLNKTQVERIHNTMDYCRNTGQKAHLDSEGYLVFKKDKQTVRVKDKEFSQHYINLQKQYSMILEDLMGTLKGKIAQKFNLPNSDFTKEDITKLLNDEKSETRKAYYKNVLETLASFEKLKRRDYVPHQRFGPYGFSVRDAKTGKLIDFTTIEAGSVFDTANKFYSKKQLKETLDRFRDEYGDSSKYVIYGKDGKKIKDFSNIENFVPFELTQKNIADHVGDSAISFDLMFSMMQSRGMDEEMLNGLHESLIKTFLSTGFAKHLTESNNIKGYSTDWTRVNHAYGTGAAHYIGNIHVDSRMEAIRSVIKEGKFADQGLKEAAQRYADYIMSPAEDYMKMRMFNFMWTMGGNPSTALLQVVTLPTLTLGNMTKFNTNVIGNMASLNKWWWLGTKFVGNAKQLDGTLVIDFAKPEVLAGLKQSGVANDKMIALLKYASEGSLTGGVSVREYAGSRKYDVDSIPGRIHEKMTIFSNLLGLPMSFMEQMTRFASLGALYESYSKVPDIENKIMEAYKDDQRFLEQIKIRKDLDIVQNAALYALDEAHAVFGKVGRAGFQRGLGGALFFPFQTYPQNAIESMARMYGQGKAGKTALITTLASMLVFAGLVGLPGAELLKELIEGLYEKFGGETVDFDYLLREKIYQATGSSTLAAGVTKGVPRMLGVDITSRIGMSVPGQDVLLSLLGMRGDVSNVLGVQGSLITQAGDFWNKYSTDASLSSTLSSLTPVAISNILKATEFANEGVYTNKNVQLIAPQDVSASTIMLRAVGVSSSQAATYREQNFYSKLLEKQYTPFIEKHREIAKRHLTRYYRLLEEGEVEDARDEMEAYKDTLRNVLETAKEKNFPIDLGSFKRSVQKAALQRQDPQKMFKKNLNKTGKKESDNLNRVLGIVE